MDPLLLVNWTLGFLLAGMTLLFLFRIVMTWYPQLDVSSFPYRWIVAPTEPFLAPSRRLIPPLGGVDITPILWVGLFSLLREVLLGQQGLLTMVLQTRV
jgi:YggT family protein